MQSLTLVHEGVHDNNGGALRWQYYVRYHYDVSGYRYWGDWTTPAARSMDALKTRCRLSEGSSIAVHYDPDHPKRSVVETGLTLRRLLPTIVGTVLIIAPATLVALMLLK